MIKEFTDESVGKNKKNEIVSNIEPKMLPTRFRERTKVHQRLYVLLFVVLYSSAMGVITFTLLGELAQKMMTVYKGNKILLITTMVFTICTLFTGCLTPFWSKNRKFLFTWVEFVIVIMSPLIYISGFLYLSYNFNYTEDDPKKLLLVIGIITATSNAAPILMSIIKTTISFKRFKNSFLKAIFVAPGNLAIGFSNFIIWLLITTNNGVLEMGTTTLYGSYGTFVGGIVLFAIGLAISLKWDVKGSRSIWTSVRVIGALPVLIIYTTLMVIGMKFMKFEISTAVIVTMITDLILLIALSLFVWFKGGIRNLVKTNPIYNNVILRLFVIFAATTGLVAITIMEDLTKMRDYGPTSFFILVITSVTILIGTVIAHFGKIITYVKFLQTMIASALVTLLLVAIIVMSIIILQRSQIILAIIARQIISVFFIFSIITEMLSLTMEVTHTIFRIIRDTREKESQGKKNKAKQAYEGVK